MTVRRLKAQMAYHAQLKEWHSEKFDQPLAREILTKLGITPAYKEGMEKIDIEWVKKALGYPEALPESNPQTQIAPVLVDRKENAPCKTCGCLTGFEDPHPEGDGPVVWCCNTLCRDCHTVFTVEEWNAR